MFVTVIFYEDRKMRLEGGGPSYGKWGWDSGNAVQGISFNLSYDRGGGGALCAHNFFIYLFY